MDMSQGKPPENKTSTKRLQLQTFLPALVYFKTYIQPIIHRLR